MSAARPQLKFMLLSGMLLCPTASLSDSLLPSQDQPTFERVSSERNLDAAFDGFARHNVRAIIVAGDLTFMRLATRFATLAVQYALPAIYGSRELAERGGLATYSASVTDAARQAGVYVGRVLKGERGVSEGPQTQKNFVNLLRAEPPTHNPLRAWRPRSSRDLSARSRTST